MYSEDDSAQKFRTIEMEFNKEHFVRPFRVIDQTGTVKKRNLKDIELAQNSKAQMVFNINMMNSKTLEDLTGEAYYAKY
jgi:hypothetical protein